MNFPEDLKYTESHEWVKFEEGNKAKVGITEYAISELTDLTYLEFNVEVGDTLSRKDAFGEIESVKATSELYLPLSGKILAINEELVDNLEVLVNDPYGDGWMLEIEVTEREEEEEYLMDAESYEKYIEEEKDKENEDEEVEEDEEEDM